MHFAFSDICDSIYIHFAHTRNLHLSKYARLASVASTFAPVRRTALAYLSLFLFVGSPL